MGSCEHFGMVARRTPTGQNMMILFAVQTHERLTTRNLLLHKCCNYSRHGAALQVDYLMKRLPTYQCLSEHQLHSLLFSSPDTTRNLIKEMSGFPRILCAARGTIPRSQHQSRSREKTHVVPRFVCSRSLKPFVSLVEWQKREVMNRNVRNQKGNRFTKPD